MSANNFIDKATDQEIETLINKGQEYVTACIKFINEGDHDGNDQK